MTATKSDTATAPLFTYTMLSRARLGGRWPTGPDAAAAGVSRGMVYLLSKNPKISRVTTFLMTYEATEPEELPPKSEVAQRDARSLPASGSASSPLPP
jgi:hypothetical protein